MTEQSSVLRYLGVDGGGSKTAFALIDANGHILARATAATSYYFSDGFEVVEHVLAQGVSAVCRQAGLSASEIDVAFFGLPGYGEASDDIPALEAIPYRILGHDRYSCDNDMVCGWAGSFAGADGINVISGTGSMTYGQRQGIGRRVGGWGELFGDDGSAYWVAAQGLNAFTRMSDGRLPHGPLYEEFRSRLEISSDLDVVSLVIDKWGGNRSAIAALATSVCAAARGGDGTAVEILVAAAGELVALVETTRVLIGFDAHDPVPVSYSGGMFSDEDFLAQFRAALHRMPVKFDLQVPLLDPAVGAAVYAATHNGQPLSANAIHELVTS